MAYLYRHIRLDTGKPFYIGIGVGRRAYDKCKRKKHWKSIVAKHGYQVEIMMEGLNWEEACQKEIEFIALYGRLNRGTGILINLTDGGEGSFGMVQSEKSKRLTRERMTGNKWCVGRILKTETKNKIKEARQHQQPTNRKGIVQYDLHGNYIADYDSANDAERRTGFYAYLITAACRKTKKGKSVYKKFVWKYVSEVTEHGAIKTNILVDKSELYNSDPFLKRRGRKLNEQAVIEIRSSKMTPLQLSKKFGVTRTTIYAILNFEQWTLLRSQ